jgi:hypothetical protein
LIVLSFICRRKNNKKMHRERVNMDCSLAGVGLCLEHTYHSSILQQQRSSIESTTNTTRPNESNIYYPQPFRCPPPPYCEDSFNSPIQEALPLLVKEESEGLTGGERDIPKPLGKRGRGGFSTYEIKLF